MSTAPVAPGATIPPPSADSSRSVRVIVVDDNDAIRRNIATLLQRKGCAVVTATSASEALQIVREHTPDVVVSDLNLGEGGSGLDLLRGAHQASPGLPVILISGQPTVDSAIQAVELRAYAYLKKPFSGEALLAAVSKAGRYHKITQAGREAARTAATREARSSEGFDRALASLWMAFQPLIDSSWRIVGYEALARNEEPTLRNPPVLFDTAFKSGRWDELTERLFELSVDPYLNTPDALLFLNVDPRQLAREPLIPHDHPLMSMASRVVLEVTERASATDLANLKKISELREMGFRVAVDDLGAGYSGLTAFAEIEPDYVKIDGSLIRQVDQHDHRQKLIKSVTDLSNDLGIQVVAEGIERIEEFEAVRDLGAHLFQGFFVGRPEPWKT